MSNITYKIYSAIHPSVEKTVTLKERIKYLSCKFWKSSKEEAEKFFNFYLGPVAWELHRPAGILSGQFLRQGNGSDAYDKIRRSVNLYRLNPRDKYFERYHKHKIILDAICCSMIATYPKDHLIDDVLDWAFQNQLINNIVYRSVQKCISDTRTTTFTSRAKQQEMCVEVIKIFLERGRYIYAGDICDLFFISPDVFQKIDSAVKTGKITAVSSVDFSTTYFEARSLIKWLLLNNSVHEFIAKEFLYLKIEALKEIRIEYDGGFNSLNKMIKQGNDRNDILSDALNKKVIVYLKYPRDYLHWRERTYSGTYMNDTMDYAEHRYDGLGQLKNRRNEDTHHCQFGGVTVDMLLYGDQPFHGLSKSIPNIEYEVEFVPTKSEADVGLQPYIKFSKDEIGKILSDRNLIVILVGGYEKVNNEIDVTEQPVDAGVEEAIIEKNSQKPVTADVKQKIWQEVFVKLHHISGSMKKGNKMRLVDEAILLVLDAVKKIHPDFDPMKMPGTVEDFLIFCLDMPCGNKIFPIKKGSFGKYCRRTLDSNNKNKIPPLCRWPNSPTPNRHFWQELKPGIKSYTVNHKVFG